jgi:hypothetical protein
MPPPSAVRDHADVLDTRVGEEVLQVALHQGVKDPEHGRDGTEGHREDPPPGRAATLDLEGEERYPEHAQLEHESGEEGGAVGRPGRMGLGTPDVQGDEAGLEAEADEREHEGGVAPLGRDVAGLAGDPGQVERARLGGEDGEGGDD